VPFKRINLFVDLTRLKTVSDSVVETCELILPEHANTSGYVYAGQIMVCAFFFILLAILITLIRRGLISVLVFLQSAMVGSLA